MEENTQDPGKPVPPVTLPFAVVLDSGSRDPLYKQLSDQIRHAILLGQLQPGAFLPATRSLADELGVSRFTVVESYRDLNAQGFIEAGRGAGSKVSPELPSTLTFAQLSVDETHNIKDKIDKTAPYVSATHLTKNAIALEDKRLSDYGARLVSLKPITEQNLHTTKDINYAAGPFELLPLKQWRALLQKHSRNEDSAAFAYRENVQGYEPLREAIAAYVARSRAVNTTPEQIAIFSGWQSAIDCLTRILINPNDSVVVESPSYIGVNRTLLYQGANITSIPVDDHGLITSQLREMSDIPKMVYCTPARQEPTGVALSLPRRLDLLDFAVKNRCYIFEDDYDSEFRYGSRPIPALQSLDENKRVVFAYTFRKMLFPLIRLAFLVLPPQLVRPVILAKATIERDLPMLEQVILTDLITSGQLERHIQKTRAIYNKRRQALVRAITHNFGRKVTISQENSGTQLLVKFQTGIPDDQLAVLASSHGHNLISTGPIYHAGESKRGEFIWPFHDVNETQIGKAVASFARDLRNKTGS